MFLIDEARVTGWKTESHGTHSYRYPHVVGITCPGCHIKHAFTLHPYGNNAVNSVNTGAPFEASCPSCQTRVRFFVFPHESDEVSFNGREIWMHPLPRARDGVPIHELDEIPLRLARDYREANDCYAAGLWRASTTQARLVMEGLVKTLLAESGAAESKASLAALFDKLAEARDFAEPIRAVGRVLRESGNLAAHFDRDLEITPELAREVLDLLDAFIDYLLLIPQRVQRLQALISKEATATHGPS